MSALQEGIFVPSALKGKLPLRVPMEPHFLYEMKKIFHLILETRSRFFTYEVKNHCGVQADILFTTKPNVK
jgi:hypothetical protein